MEITKIQRDEDCGRPMLNAVKFAGFELLSRAVNLKKFKAQNLAAQRLSSSEVHLREWCNGAVRLQAHHTVCAAA